MQWQLIVVLGLAVSAVLFLVASVSYLNIRGIYSAAQRVLRLRSGRAKARSMTEASCRG
jgi:hypothetical protein